MSIPVITIQDNENLNKVNFFNQLQELYPEAMGVFCQWIDDYKKRIKWDQYFYLFLKFHDLPFEMQTGIMYEFFRMQSITFMELAGSVYSNKEGIVKYFIKSFEHLNKVLVLNKERAAQ